MPPSIGISILRYRLYELDVVIRKTVVFVILATLIMAVSLGILLFLSTLTFAVPEESERAAIAAATFVIGLLAWPLWKLARRIADRVVFGGRSSPYEVLTQFAERVGETYSSDDVLPRMAEVLGRATGAEVARVWLRVGDELRPEAAWPTDAPAAGSTPAEPGTTDPETSFSAEVRHRGELLGALGVAMPANDPMNPSKERLVRDLAAQAGPMLHNVLLVEDLRESRRRIVSAQDERAKKLERDLHDGAQQQLVALGVKMRLLDGLLEKDPAKGHDSSPSSRPRRSTRWTACATSPAASTRRCSRSRGCRRRSRRRLAGPPFRPCSRRTAIGRYPQDVESAVYFCTLEALNNVAKYAEAATTTITLAQENGRLTFTVRDDGKGFDPDASERGTGLQGMADRLDALGGELRVESRPGARDDRHGDRARADGAAAMNRRRLPWVIWGIAVVMLPVTLYLTVRNGSFTDDWLFISLAVVMMIGYVTMGALVASRVPRNPVGWLLMTTGVAFLSAAFFEEYATFALSTEPGSLPFGRVALWFVNWLFLVAVAPVPLLLALFPTGTVASSRWRWLPLAIIGVFAVGIVASILRDGPVDIAETGPDPSNPTGVEAIGAVLEPISYAAGVLGIALTVLAVISLVPSVPRGEGG